MKKSYLIFFCIILLFIQAHVVFSDEEDEEEIEPTSVPAPASVLKRGLIASGEILLSNLFLLSYNVIALGDISWSIPDYESIHGNFTRDWDWERGDGFFINQLGHPIQGSFYFNAGRVNGFGFYESIFFNLLGSATWEAFGEAGHASMNDFITTVTVPISIGEMIYRLYIEACEAGAHPLVAALVNPMAGFHWLVTDWQPPKYGIRLYQLRTFIGAGYAETSYSTSADSSKKAFSFKGALGELGVSLIYGDPFLQDSRVPYDHFELDFHAGINPAGYMNLRFVSHGFLLSFCPVDTEENMMSTGLSLHLDYTSQGELILNYSTIDQYSYALDWSVKYQHLFSENFSFQVKAHAGLTLMGVATYYSPPRDDHNINNYGFGFNEKCNIIFAHKKLGRLDMRIMHYIIWSFQNSGINDPSNGNVNWLFTDFTYSYLFTKHLSVGLTCSLAWEWGEYGGYPDTRKTNREYKLFVAWNL
jgi:hypothetical protein